MRKRLTDLSVERMKEPGEFWHTGLAAFGIRIGKRIKVWQVAIRPPGEKHPTRIKIGTFPEMKFAEAKKRAGEIIDGGAAGARVPFKNMIEPFLEHGRTRTGKPWRASTRREYRSILNGTAKPLHTKPIANIRRRDIAGLLAAVDKATGPSNAALTRATLSRFWSWLLETDRADASPVTGSPSYAIPKRDRVLSDAELRALWAQSDPSTDFGMILRIMLWTGCRRAEAGGMAWSEIEGDIWTFPAARVKTDRALALPLPRQALTALEAWPVTVGRDLLFGRGPGGFTYWGVKKALDKKLGFNRPFQLRDVRRTTETRLAELGVSKEIRARILNHDLGEIEERYNVYAYMPEKRAALQTWADALERIVR
jgi:integrase